MKIENIHFFEVTDEKIMSYGVELHFIWIWMNDFGSLKMLVYKEQNCLAPSQKIPFTHSATNTWMEMDLANDCLVMHN